MNAIMLDPSEVRDIAPLVLDDAGRLRVLPADFWAGTTPEERALFGHRFGIYGFPTVELVAHLRELIDGRSAIEIGAGHGLLAQALEIPATDNMQQRMPKYRAVYELAGQPVVPYGDNVIDMDAHAAVRRLRPDVVIGSWVTHKYDPKRHFAGGNEIGVDEADVIGHCGLYVNIGNDRVHEVKPIWDMTHVRIHPPFVYSRAANGSRDFVATWEGAKG